MPINPTTDDGQVRLLANDVADAPDQVFTDAEIQAFLTLEGGNIKRAAAQAIDTIADNEALISKVIRSQDLQTDGAKVAESLRKRAAALRAQADEADDNAGSAFELVKFKQPCERDPELTRFYFGID